MKYLNIFFLAVCLMFASSCDLQLQDDPNELTPDKADVDFLLNGMQYGVNEYFFELTDYTMEAVRMCAMEPRSGTYETAYQPQDFDDMWEQAYVGILTDGNTLIGLAEARGLFVHSGIARTLQAYTLMTLVDFFGDIPWSEALDPNTLTPNNDDGASVYAAAEGLLNAAIDDFDREALGVPANDLFYGGDAAKWKALANTLKLRLYLTTRLVDTEAISKINKLVQDEALIDGSADWEFPFSTDGTTNPSSTHPYFDDNYGGASDYMSNYYMWLLADEKSVTDPRLRYYFYRQTLDIPDGSDPNDVNELPCIVENYPSHWPGGMVFCTVGNGYWGRDHIDTDGIPPDNLLRTIFGLYPVGGRFDADDGAIASFSDGAQGAGVHPLMHANWVEFMLAETALADGRANDAAAHLEAGVRGSMDKVLNFAPSAVVAQFAATPEDVDAYVAVVNDLYNNAADDAARMEVIQKEYFLATWGNGIEAYNAYRRTGSPVDAQLPLNDQPGPFIRSFAYPSVSVNRNANISSKGTVAAPVFWDTNPPGFVD